MADPLSTALSNPVILSFQISMDFKGEVLDKTKNNWKRWSKSFTIAAHINNLSRFLEADLSRPDDTDAENFCRWSEGDGALTALMLNSISEDDQDHVLFARLAWVNLAALRARHKNQGVPHQISQLQIAFSTKFSPDVPLLKTAKDIREHVQAAFASAAISEDLMTSICILHGLEGNNFTHL